MPKGIGYPNKSVRGRVQATNTARKKAIKKMTPDMLKKLTKKR